METNKIYVRFIANHVKGFAYVSGEEGWVDRDRIAHALATGKVVETSIPEARIVRPLEYATRGRKPRG